MAAKDQQQPQKASISESKGLNRQPRSAAQNHAALDPLQSLQRNLGNSYLQAIAPLPTISNGLNSQWLQPKLTIGSPNDVYEQEADRVADQVMRMPEPTVQRQLETEEEEEEPLQAKPIAGQITPLIQPQMVPEEEEEDVAQLKPIEGQSLPLVQRKRSAYEQVEPLQLKLSSGQPKDQYEQEADRVADQVTQIPDSSIQRQVESEEDEEEETIQRKTVVNSITPLQRDSNNQDQTSEVPPNVHKVLQSPGHPLDSKTRTLMERRFGWNFSRVRVHTGTVAEQSARDINANAYTMGHNIVFGAGQFVPGTQSAQRLIAHELTHVVQQSLGQGIGYIQTKPSDKKSAGGPKSIVIKIRVNRELSDEELRYEFVRQYYGCTSDAQVQSKLKLWDLVPKRGTLPQEVKQGFIVFTVTDENLTDFDTLSPDEKKAVNAETDRRFWESTGYKPGQKLGTSVEDRKMAQVWMGVRNAVLTEDKQRKEIDALPDDIKKILFAGGVNAPTISRDDYTQVLRIANKLTKLSPEARKDYLSRINASTTSWNELENSIDSYFQFQAQRDKEAQEHETAAAPLLNVGEDVYTAYRNYKSLQSSAATAQAAKGVARDKAAAQDSVEYLDERVKEAETNLLAILKYKGFDSIPAFEAAIEAYRVAFRTQTINIALDVLDHYDHMLFEERKKLQQSGAAAIVKGIASTQAAALYKESDKKSALAGRVSSGRNADLESAQTLREEAHTARAQAESEVIRGSGNNPLVAERGTDREKLASLDAAGAQTYLLDILNKRAEDVRSTRQELKDHPDRVFSKQELVNASLQVQGIAANSIYDRIISDYIKQERANHLLSEIAIGILVIALTFLVPGGGWVAAAALVANAGISTYQAYNAFKEYESQERDYNLHLLSQEPSLFWVGVAIAAAALDLSIAASLVIKESSTALKALEGPLLEFSRDSDLAKLVSKIEAAEGLRPKVKEALKREAEASLAAKEATREALKRVSDLHGSLPGAVDPGVVTQLFRAFYNAIKQNINTFVKFRKQAEYYGVLEEITGLSGAQRAELEEAFKQVKEMVTIGTRRKMDEASLLGYIDRWALNRGKPDFQIKLLNEMRAWKELTAEQQQVLNKLKNQKNIVNLMYERMDVVVEDLAVLRSKKSKTPEELAEIRALEKEINENPGLIKEANWKLQALEAEAAKANLTLYDRLRAAVPSGPARERTLKGWKADSFDQIGTLRKTSGELQADHIVSVREIADMDGFADLPWIEQKRIVDMKENLIAMDASANASKNDSSWKTWRNAREYYYDSTIADMIKKESIVRENIRKAIQDRLSELKIKL